MKKLFFAPKISALLVVLLAGFAIQCTIPQIPNQARTDNQVKTEPFSINKAPLPAPTGFVNDYVGVIDSATKQRLEQRLTDLKAQTNPQVEIGVAIVDTTGNRDISEYSLAVARGWGIGSKEDDNPSALLFIAVNDRKYFTQVSKDLQDELPDGVVGQLQRQYLVPAFKQQNYGKGIEDTIEAYIRVIEGKQINDAPTPPTASGKTNEENGRRTIQTGSSGLCNTMFCLIILFILLMIIFSGSGRRGRKNRNDRNRWGGGGGFGGGGSALPWILGSIIANSASRGSSSGWGGSSDWGGSSSGGWGGFGGGGDFDGGGAGGSW